MRVTTLITSPAIKSEPGWLSGDEPGALRPRPLVANESATAGKTEDEANDETGADARAAGLEPLREAPEAQDEPAGKPVSEEPVWPAGDDEDEPPPASRPATEGVAMPSLLLSSLADSIRRFFAGEGLAVAVTLETDFWNDSECEVIRLCYDRAGKPKGLFAEIHDVEGRLCVSWDPFGTESQYECADPNPDIWSGLFADLLEAWRRSRAKRQPKLAPVLREAAREFRTRFPQAKIRAHTPPPAILWSPPPGTYNR